MACTNQMKQIGLALHNYDQVNRVLPPGTICRSDPIQPSNQYNVWDEAAKSGHGPQGTGFLLAIRPFIDTSEFIVWNYKFGVLSSKVDDGRCYSNFAIASMDTTKDYYCPSRRNGLRPGDRVMMLSTTWTGGGTDYGGCVGRHAAFTSNTGYNLCDATMYYEPSFYPAPFKGKVDDTPDRRWGIFGRVNVGTSFKEVRDGMSNTIMTGELQRITNTQPTSKDGWVIGGPATLFTTGAMFGDKNLAVRPQEATAVARDGLLMNNGFFGSPGSDHAGGANFGMGDGSVRFISTSVDPNIFALLGSMADGVEVKETD
jgi:prepilin-type processing-associated H-X9-DG protein